MFHVLETVVRPSAMTGVRRDLFKEFTVYDPYVHETQVRGVSTRLLDP